MIYDYLKFDPRVDGFFSNYPLLKKEFNKDDCNLILEKSYYFFYKYYALYMDRYGLFKDNLLSINEYWINYFYNYDDLSINFIIEDKEMYKMINFLLLNGIKNPKTGNNYRFYPVVGCDYNQLGYIYDEIYDEYEYSNYEDTILYLAYKKQLGSGKPFWTIREYNDDNENKYIPNIDDNLIIENIANNIKKCDEKWKLQLKEVEQKMNLFNNILCNRRCPNCGNLLYLSKSSVLFKNFCNDCNEKKDLIKSTRKVNLKNRGYKICSNGRVDLLLSSKTVYNRYNGICCNCGEKTSFELSRYDDLYPNKDHIIPIDKGGENIYNNTQLLCRYCNLSKSTKVNDELKIKYLNNKEIYERNFDKVKSTNIISNLRCYNCNKYGCNGFIRQDDIDFYCNDCKEEDHFYKKQEFLNNEVFNEESKKVKFKDFEKMLNKEIVGFKGIVFLLADTEEINNNENYICCVCNNHKYKYYLKNVVYICNNITNEIVDKISKRNYYVGIVDEFNNIKVLNLNLKNMTINKNDYFLV